MFKNLILAALFAVSFGGATLTAAMPAAAADDDDPREQVEFVYGELLPW
jgi:hypothetical protein